MVRDNGARYREWRLSRARTQPEAARYRGHIASTEILPAAIVSAAFLTIERIEPSTRAVDFRFPPYGAKM
jgi:hypothetical protein